MDKAELSKLLENKVQEKLQEGYTITTYALDAASRDRLKRDLKPHSCPTHHDDCASPEWDAYLKQIEVGEYKPDLPATRKERTPVTTSEQPVSSEHSSSSAGVWRVRRH